MKKILCLTLIVLTMLCVFTGCSGTASIMRENNGAGANGSTGIGRNDQGNVSTSRDGTVNGHNRTGNGTSGGGMFGGASSGSSGGAMSGAR